MKFFNFRVPIPAILMLTLFMIMFLTQTMAVSLSSSYCNDPTFDSCILTISFPKAQLISTTSLRITSPQWLSAISSLAPNSPGCSFTPSALVVTPNLVQSAQSNPHVVVFCRLNLNPGFYASSIFDSTSQLLLPDVAYYSSPFEITPLDSSCGDSSNPDSNCPLSLSFSGAALPFDIQTTSLIVSSSTLCWSNLDVTPKLYITISEKTGPPAGLIRTFHFDGTAEFQDNISEIEIICHIFATKHIVSPYLKILTRPIEDEQSIELYSSQALIYTDLAVYLGLDCTNQLINACTLIYSINELIPAINDFKVVSPGFPQQLTQPFICPPETIQTALFPSSQPLSRIFLCQRWRKTIQVAQVTVWPNIVTQLSPAINMKSDQLFFAGTYFQNIRLSIPSPWLIEYISPIWFDFEDCNSTSQFACRMSIRSSYSGPAITVSFNIPYSGVIQSSTCSSQAFFNSETRLFQLPGGRSTSVQAAHPSEYDLEYHYCDVYILRNIFQLYPSITIRLARYQEYLSRSVGTHFAEPDPAKLSLFQTPNTLTAFSDLPLGVETLNNCLDPDDPFCTLRLYKSIPSLPLLSFKISFPSYGGGVSSDNWSFELVNPETNLGTVSVSTSLYMYSSPPGALNPCRVTPASTDPPAPPCDITHPNDPANPCTPCQDTVVLFWFQINGVENNDFKLTLRKHERASVYEDLYRVYWYGGIQFGSRLDSGLDYKQLYPQADPPLISISNPRFAFEFNPDCANPSLLQCSAYVTRRSLTDTDLYFLADQSNAILRYNLTTPVQIENKWLAYWNLDVDTYFNKFNILISLEKKVGVNHSFAAIQYPVEVIDGIRKFSRPSVNHVSPVLFSNDGYPVFNEDCSQVPAPICGSVYTFKSFVPTRSDMLLQRTLIKHWIHSSEFIFELQFRTSTPAELKIDPNVAPYNTKLTPEEIADTELQIYDADCDNVPAGAIIIMLWKPSADGPLADTKRGTIEYRLIEGTFLGIGFQQPEIVCHLSYVKRFTITPSPRIRDFPINLYDQPSTDWMHRTDQALLRVPIFHHNRMRVSSLDDCITQDITETKCTINFEFFGSPNSPIKTLSQYIPSFFSHPLSPPGRYELINDLAFDAPGNPNREVLATLTIYDREVFDSPNDKRELLFEVLGKASQERHISTWLVAKAATTPVAYPYSAFLLHIVPNRQFAVDAPNLPTIGYPPTLTGIIVTTGSNATYSRPAHNHWIRFEYYFEYPLDYIDIDSDFNISEDAKLPCYKIHNSNDFLDKTRYDALHVEEGRYEILAWFYTNPVTKKSRLAPNVPSIELAPPITVSPFSPRIGTKCYFYFQLSQVYPTKTNHVHHSIGARAFTDLGNGGEVFTYHYYSDFPRYTAPSTIVNVDGSAKNNSSSNDSSMPHFNMFIIVTLSFYISSLFL